MNVFFRLCGAGCLFGALAVWLGVVVVVGQIRASGLGLARGLERPVTLWFLVTTLWILSVTLILTWWFLHRGASNG